MEATAERNKETLQTGNENSVDDEGSLPVLQEPVEMEGKTPTSMEDDTSQSASEAPKKKSKGKIAIVAILILILLAVLVLLMMPKADSEHHPDGSLHGDSVGHNGIGWSPDEMLGDANTGSSSSPADSGGWNPGQILDAFSGESDSVSDASSTDSDSDGAESRADDGSESLESSRESDSPASSTGEATGTVDIETDGDPLTLTAGRWDDNQNWPFFSNLVSAEKIAFPAYGLDPRNRIKVTLVGNDGKPVAGKTVVIRDESNEILWTAKANKDGVAYLFVRDGKEAVSVESEGVKQDIAESKPDESGQGTTGSRADKNDITLNVSSASQSIDGMQIMFIIDTTGSMSDELAYMQKDFASIAREVGNDGIEWSVNFYRDDGDDYVTETHHFTGDTSHVSEVLLGATAEGGGDMPEAVDQILKETIQDNDAWRDNSSKLAFMIFDAPPHQDSVDKVQEAVNSAASKGIKIVPVVASNSERDTELFGRALAIETGAPYVFLTDDSGVGDSHLEPIIGDYEVKKLHDIIVDIIKENR